MKLFPQSCPVKTDGPAFLQLEEFFSDKMNFSEWLGHILPCDLHFSRDLPHIPVCYASPLSRQYFLLLRWCAFYLHEISILPSLLPGWKEASLDLTLSAPNIASYPRKKIIIYQSLHPRSTSHPVSLHCVTSEVTSPLWSSISMYKIGIKTIKGIKWGNMCKRPHI